LVFGNNIQKSLDLDFKISEKKEERKNNLFYFLFVDLFGSLFLVSVCFLFEFVSVAIPVSEFALVFV
jgi:hypothetical protein